jgi:hypothetical protein
MFHIRHIAMHEVVCFSFLLHYISVRRYCHVYQYARFLSSVFNFKVVQI